MTIEQEWLQKHEANWGLAGVRAIAEKGVSPYAWDVPGNRALIRRLAQARVITLAPVV